MNTASSSNVCVCGVFECVSVSVVCECVECVCGVFECVSVSVVCLSV